MGSFLYEIRLAGRSLRRSPGFVAAAVLSLGLAIGAAIAGFSVLDAVRFRDLPFPAPDRLVLIGEAPKAGCPFTCDVHYKTLALLREQRFQSLQSLAAFAGGPKALGTGENQVDVTAGIVSGTLFSMLGVAPELGRTFSPEEDRLGAPPTMVIGHDLWMTYFGGDRAVLGKTFILSDEPFTLIGVMPPGFSFESRTQVWLAASRYLDPRTGTSLRATYVLGRLRPGATGARLAAELGTLEAAANEGRPDERRTTFVVAPLRSRYITATRSHDLIFAAIVGAILLIACANVAGLVLVRAMRNGRELAIRTAVGGSRAQLARFLFLQNVLLAAGGVGVGLALAEASLGLLRSAAQLQSFVRVPGMEYRLDLHVALFAAALTVIAAALLTLAPLRLLAHSELQQALRENAPTASRRGNRTQQLFVVVQTACAVALLVTTGLLVKTALRVAGVALGYDSDHVVQVTVVPAHAGRVREKYLPLTDRLLADFTGIPGVDRAAVRASVPFTVATPGEPPTALLDGSRLLPPDRQPRVAFGVSPDYFAVLGIPVGRGRAFGGADLEAAPAVAIINQWAASHWWPGENPVGRTIVVDSAPGRPATLTVVGVAHDNLAAAGSVLLAKPDGGPEVYRPFAQANFWIGSFLVRSNGPPGGLVPEVQKIVMRLVPNGRPPASILADQVSRQLESVRANAMEIAGFAVMGLLLAITGLYGVLSYLVQQRIHEIGIRGVLGATRRQILGLVLGQAFRLALLGVFVGLVAAGLAMGLVQGMLYGTPPADPVVYAGVAGLVLGVALAAGYFPARRATRVDAATALRSG